MSNTEEKINARIAKKLSQIYYTPSHPAAFSSLNKLWIATGKKISKKNRQRMAHEPRHLHINRVE